MAQKHSREKRIADSFKLGEANAALIPRLQRWCDHLRVEQTSAGLLAEMSGLPIGMIQVTCPHASKGIQAMQLREVAAYFVTQNCQSCPHHKELHPDNVGREILRTADQVREERSKPKPVTSESKRRLRGLVSGDLTQALRSAPTTEQSVLELVALLDQPDHAEKAAAQLLKAAELAPEFFSSLACEVIAEHLAGMWHGGKCAEVLMTIGQKRKSIPPVAITAALLCIEHDFCHDDVLDLLGDHFAAGGELPDVMHIGLIICHHGYTGSTPFAQQPTPKAGQLHALFEIGKRDLGLLAKGFGRLLQQRHKRARIAAGVTFRGLVSALPGLGLLLTDAFIASLQLDDDHDHDHVSADFEACNALAEIYCVAPSDTQGKLDTAFDTADEEVKELLFRVHSSVVGLGSDERHRNRRNERAIACLPQVLDVLISTVSAEGKPLEVRERAAETIDRLAWDRPQLLLPRLDALFGLLAMISHEEATFIQKNPGGNPQMPGFPRVERLKYSRVCHELVEVLEKLAKGNPTPVQATLFGVLAPLNSKDPAQELLKVRLVKLFERLSRDTAIAPAIIPHLFNCLMDMDSVLVRVAALEVIEDLLRLRPELVPDNMREMLVVYLRDPYVGVHQGAALAMRFMQPDAKQQAREIANDLLAQFVLYEKQREDSTHLQHLAEAMVNICRGFPDLLILCAMPVLLKQARGNDEDSAQEALEELRCCLSHAPHLGRLYVHELLDFFARFPQDAYDSSAYSTGQRLFVSLFDLPSADIATNLPKFSQTVKVLANAEPFVALQFISVLLHHEEYDSAATAADEVVAALPPGERHGTLRLQAQLTAAVAKTEAKVKTREIPGAFAALQQAKPILSKYVSDTHGDKPNALIEAFSVAHRVAERLE